MAIRAGIVANVSPGVFSGINYWVGAGAPARLLDLDFRHLIGAHGRLLKDDARQNLENVVRSVFR